jgi:hypothetical protein
VVITNTGPDELTITGLAALGGENPSEFVVSAPALPVTLSPDTKIVVSIRFAPRRGGARSAMLFIHDNGFRSPQSVSLNRT